MGAGVAGSKIELLVSRGIADRIDREKEEGLRYRGSTLTFPDRVFGGEGSATEAEGRP